MPDAGVFSYWIGCDAIAGDVWRGDVEVGEAWTRYFIPVRPLLTYVSWPLGEMVSLSGKDSCPEDSLSHGTLFGLVESGVVDNVASASGPFGFLLVFAGRRRLAGSYYLF